jgi:hypothetical protein
MRDSTALLFGLLRAGLAASRGEVTGPCPVEAAQWEKVALRAVQQGMAAVVLDTVRTCWPDAPVPDAARKALIGARLQTAARNTVLLHQLAGVLRACTAPVRETNDPLDHAGSTTFARCLRQYGRPEGPSHTSHGLLS